MKHSRLCDATTMVYKCAALTRIDCSSLRGEAGEEQALMQAPGFELAHLYSIHVCTCTVHVPTLELPLLVRYCTSVYLWARYLITHSLLLQAPYSEVHGQCVSTPSPKARKSNMEDPRDHQRFKQDQHFLPDLPFSTAKFSAKIMNQHQTIPILLKTAFYKSDPRKL